MQNEYERTFEPCYGVIIRFFSWLHARVHSESAARIRWDIKYFSESDMHSARSHAKSPSVRLGKRASHIHRSTNRGVRVSFGERVLLSSRSFLTAQHHHNTCVHWCPIRLWKRRKRGAFEQENHRHLITQACPRLVTISYIRKRVGYIVFWDNLGSLGPCSLVVRLRYASGCQYQLSCQLNGGKVLTM